ncbi:hypothetical protein [Sphingobacterium phlebotomi]|nr:hypothetical protein [Sphingobacterium phlebotomi]
MMMMSTYDGNRLLYTKTLSACGNTSMLGNGVIIPPIDAKKMDVSFIR